MTDLYGIYNENDLAVPGISTGTITSLNQNGSVSVQSVGRALGELAWPYEGTPAIGDSVCIGFPSNESGSAFIIGWSPPQE